MQCNIYQCCNEKTFHVGRTQFGLKIGEKKLFLDQLVQVLCTVTSYELLYAIARHIVKKLPSIEDGIIIVHLLPTLNTLAIDV